MEIPVPKTTANVYKKGNFLKYVKNRLAGVDSCSLLQKAIIVYLT